LFSPGTISHFFAVRLPMTHGKHSSPCIVRTAHGNGTLPCKMLPCALCRAPRRKTHDKDFAVRFHAFAVRPGRTTNSLFPVVDVQEEEYI
jgi:hypothetical protein